MLSLLKHVPSSLVGVNPSSSSPSDGGVVRYRHQDFKAIDGIMPKTFKEISD